MAKRILPLAFIFGCARLGRTYFQDPKLRQKVVQLWGTIWSQEAPKVYYQVKTKPKARPMIEEKPLVEEVDEVVNYSLIPDSNDISVKLKIFYRRKGLVWYSTYNIDFDGRYCVLNSA